MNTQLKAVDNEKQPAYILTALRGPSIGAWKEALSKYKDGVFRMILKDRAAKEFWSAYLCSQGSELNETYDLPDHFLLEVYVKETNPFPDSTLSFHSVFITTSHRVVDTDKVFNGLIKGEVNAEQGIENFLKENPSFTTLKLTNHITTGFSVIHPLIYSLLLTNGGTDEELEAPISIQQAIPDRFNK